MTPWWLLLTGIAFVDWVVDWALLLTLGLVCRSCAGFFIWVINIAHLPFTIWGWAMTIMLEVFAFPIDGWMLLFGGSGCFFRWGKHCWFRKLNNKGDVRSYWNIPVLSADTNAEINQGIQELDNLFKFPQLEKNSDILRVRHQSRKNLLA